MSNTRSQSLNSDSVWEKYLRFEKFTREKDDDLNNFITEWVEKMTEAQSVGCHYSDLVLALKLIEKVNLDLESTQFFISKLGSGGSKCLLPKVISEIQSNDFSRSKEKLLSSSEDAKQNKQLGLKGSFQDEMSAYADFSEYDEEEEKPDLSDVIQSDPDQSEPIDRFESADQSEQIDKSDLDDEKSTQTYGCAQCSHVFRSKVKLEKHLKIHTNSFQCSKCEKCFLTKNVLKVHIRRCQPGVTLNLDDMIVANKSMDKNENRNASEDNYKDESRISPCEICGRLIKESNMKKHLATHSRKVECDICHKKFSNKTHLKYHGAIHTIRKRDFVCTVCGKGFKTQHVLKGHMNIHTKAKSFICAWCGKKFFNPSSWKFHVRSQHTGDNAHQCDICQKTFYTATRLRYHKWTHTGEKPYKCEYCGKGFRDRSTFRRHIRRIHSILDDIPQMKTIEYDSNNLIPQMKHIDNESNKLVMDIAD